MVTRRDFLTTALTAAAAFPLAACGAETSKETMNKMEESTTPALGLPGVQLYTVRSLMEADVSGTLAEVARIGYKEVEFHNYFGVPVTEIANILIANGLVSPATHASVATFESLRENTIEDVLTVGQRFLVCAWLPEDRRQSLDDYRRFADQFNEWGADCKAAGIQFAYHNHDFEFVNLEGETPYDLLLERTDSDLVKMELDLFWIRKAGREPLPYFEKYPGRFELCHVKDMDMAGEMTEVGSGTIDFASDFSHAELAGFKHYFVEHDNAAEPLASITTSFERLKRLLG